jgi:hypothetical protein
MELLVNCWKVIQEFGELPFNGATTCATVMDVAMKRFRHDHNVKHAGGRNGCWVAPNEKLEIPATWMKTLYDLQAKARCERNGIL